MPEWTNHAIWWHVYPLGFVGADIRPEGGAQHLPVTHRLRHLEGWLDYAVELGASGMALGPIFASESHGYDTVDHYRIDPRLGDEADFDRLVGAAHSKGLRVLVDGVFNHVGTGHPAFAEAVTGGPSAAHADWFRLTWPHGPDGWQPGQQPTHTDFEGHGGLVALDHDSLAVAELVGDVMGHWLGRGADGWRLDAAYAVPPAFWARVVPGVRAEFPDAWFVGEVLHGDYAAIVAESTLDSVTQYELWKATWSALKDRNFFELAWALDRHNGFLECFTPMTFVGNHDVTRLATTLADDGLAALAVVLLCTVGGIPSIYYGDEQAFRGLKEERWGGDDAVRPAFPATPAELASVGGWMYRLHQELLGLRRRHPWLVRARTTVDTLENTRLVYRSTDPDGNAALIVNLDVGAGPRARVQDPQGATLFEYAAG